MSKFVRRNCMLLAIFGALLFGEAVVAGTEDMYVPVTLQNDSQNRLFIQFNTPGDENWVDVPPGGFSKISPAPKMFGGYYKVNPPGGARMPRDGIEMEEGTFFGSWLVRFKDTARPPHGRYVTFILQATCKQVCEIEKRPWPFPDARSCSSRGCEFKAVNVNVLHGPEPVINFSRAEFGITVNIK